MLRDAYQRELHRLQDELLVLGSMVESALRESVDILKRRDHEAAKKLRKADHEINKKRFLIEDEVLTLIATQQPVAGDMRILAAILEISTELERLGDYAKGIAKIDLLIGDEPLVKPLIDIPLMADRACEMLKSALDAFARQDIELAKSIPPKDKQVDRLYNQVYRELMEIIRRDPETIDQANHLLWAAHNLERTADRTLNICERVVYMVTGDLVELTGKGVKEYVG
jgi:phosphate transport system protein